MTNAFPELVTVLGIFPSFRAIPAEEWAVAKPQLRIFPEKAAIFHRENAAEYAVFILAGTVQISHVSEGGSEALSNRLTAGDICTIMVLSGLSEREYPGTMTAETDVTALFVAKSSFLRWIQQYASIRHEVFGNILDGLIQMGSALSSKQSLPLDMRLMELLLKKTSEEQPSVHITHQQLAFELGSAREVVSRILKRIHNKGWIETGRGWVTVKERRSLRELDCD